MDDYISRADAIEEISKGVWNVHELVDRIKALPSADAVSIHNDGTLEVKVPNAQKVGRVLVMDTDSHIGGGLFYPADAVQGEWEDREVFNETDDDHIVEEWQSARCSVCGKYHTTPYMYYFDDFNYCPNCGARIKGGDDK